MTSKENLDFPVTVLKRYIKDHLGHDMILSTEFTKAFGKSLRVFVHYLMTM